MASCETNSFQRLQNSLSRWLFLLFFLLFASTHNVEAKDSKYVITIDGYVLDPGASTSATQATSSTLERKSISPDHRGDWQVNSNLSQVELREALFYHAFNLVQELYDDGRRSGAHFTIEYPYRSTEIFGRDAISLRIILPSEKLRPVDGYWDHFELSLGFEQRSLDSEGNPVGILQLVVAEYRTAKRGLGINATPSFGLDFDDPDFDTRLQRQEDISTKLVRAVRRIFHRN